MMNNQIQGPQMNANVTDMNDSADKENMQPSVPPTPYALPQPQQQQPQMVPQVWPMPGSQGYLDEQKRFGNMMADLQESCNAYQAQQMMMNNYGHPFAPMNNHASAPSSANTSDSGIVSGKESAEGENLPDWKIKFFDVPGRLSLLGNQKYRVTQAEIKRRLGKPEHLNQSALNGILRRAKGKEVGDDLTKKLANFQVNLEQGRRKSVQSTVFTALTEEEAKQIVTDFRNLNENHFYDKDLAYESLTRTTSLAEHATKLRNTQCAQMAMRDIFSVLDKVVSPVCDEPTDVQSTLHPKTQEKFDDFSKVTHGFGLPSLRVSWDAYNRTLSECVKAYQNPKAFCDDLQRPLPQSMNALFGMNADQKPVPSFASAATPMQKTKRNSGAGMGQTKKTTPKGQAEEQEEQ